MNSNINPPQPMVIPSSSNMSNVSTSYLSDPKNVAILVLCVLLFFSFLGINILDIISNFIKLIIRIFGPLISQLLSVLGFTTGTILNKSADVISDTGKTALDIAEGTVQNVGNLMIKASKSGVNMDTQSELEKALHMNQLDSQARDDDAANPIQKPISANKNGWCLIGEYENKRGCIEVNDADKCMSGQVYPTQQACMNPV